MHSTAAAETKKDVVTTSHSMISVIREHLIKGGAYLCLLIHSIRSVRSSLSTFSFIINALIVVFSTWLLYGEIDLITKRVHKKLPPGNIGFPVLREIRIFRDLSNTDFVNSLLSIRKQFGPLFTVKSFMGINIILAEEDNLNWLFRHDRKALTDASWPPNIQMLLGSSAVPNQVGRYHRVLRRLLEPYFAPSFVQNYFQRMDEVTQQELEKWSSTGNFLSSEVFKMYSLRLFYVSSLGDVNEEILKRLYDDYKQWIAGFFTFSTKRIPGTSFDNAMKARERILNEVDKLIHKFEEENPEGSERAKTTIIGGLIYGKDTTAGEKERFLSRDEIKDNILAVIFAGHDTTYASISTIMHHLSQNPQTLKVLTDEIMHLKHVNSLDCDEVKAAPILNAVIYEALRMDPPVPGGFRKAQKTVEHQGWTFDPGTVFNYSILLSVNDESTYKNHDQFCMERFLPDTHPLYQKALDSGVDPRQGKAAYPVFGGGTHVCLGRAFALQELRVLLVRMLRHYTVEVKNSQKLVFPINGWQVDFRLTTKKLE